MPTATNPPTPAAAAPIGKTSQLALPPPATFDILPPLDALLTRVLLPTSNGTLTSSSPQSIPSDQPLSPKDLAIAASAITAKIQKARMAVRLMEGVEIGLQEQEEIIADLETESTRGKRVLDRLRADCARATAEYSGKDEEMNAINEEAVEDSGMGDG